MKYKINGAMVGNLNPGDIFSEDNTAYLKLKFSAKKGLVSAVRLDDGEIIYYDPEECVMVFPGAELIIE